MVARHIKSLIRRLSSWRKRAQDPVRSIHAGRAATLSSEKSAELENLCNQLFRRKDLITSGKLSFIGLAQIKKRMGRQWNGLCKIVYATAEEVIGQYTGPGDIFIRYKDDTYILIFARSTPEESRLKGTLIAQEIRRRLFEMDEADLRDLEIRQTVGEIRTDKLMDLSFPDMMDAMDSLFDDRERRSGDSEKQLPPAIKTVEVEATHCKPQATLQSGYTACPECAWLPLWDTRQGALTAYLCLAQGSFDAHKKLYEGKSAAEKAALDMAMIRNAAAELKRMEDHGRKFYLICPVQHETVYSFESYEPCKALLSRIPQERRAFLMILVMNMEDGLPSTQACWFAKPLRSLCPQILAEIPLRRDINFHYLHNSGVNVAGVRLNAENSMPEQDVIALLNGFSIKAKSLKIPRTFVLGVNSLSLTTSAVCAGFDYLGGPAIHEAIDRPDAVHRYRYENLLTGLRPPGMPEK